MDPLSVTASVAGIATACLMTAKALNNLRSKFTDAQMTIAAICAETTIIGTTLAKIQGILLNNPQVLTAEIHDAPGLEIQATFDIALTGCSVIYSCLDIEVQKLQNYANASNQPDWKTKAKLYWKDDTMKELLGNLRGHQGSISLLINILQIETVADIHRIVKEKERADLLEGTAVRTRSLRALYPQSKAPESIFAADEAHGDLSGETASVVGSSIFGFDETLVNSNVYRKTLMSAWKRNAKSKDQSPADADPEASSISEKIHVSGRSKRQMVLPTKTNQDLLSINTLALRRCGESVMGPWAKDTVRKFRTREFRFEVIFWTPILLTASPDNGYGGSKSREVHYVDGSPSSYARTSVEFWNGPLYYASDERASWYILLSTLQIAESSSREWDERSRNSKLQHLKRPIYDLAVGLRRKSMSWDFMPSAVQKPFATSSICYIVEIVSMLGMVWKAFDDTTWSIRAEGNGCHLTSLKAEGLGVMVLFSVTGRTKFENRRVTPTTAIK